MPDPTVTPDKKPRRRRSRKSAPLADATPRKPRTTLKARIAAMGPTHLDAYRVLCDGAEFDAALRDALGAYENHTAAVGAVARATGALDAAEQRLTDAERALEAGKATLARLDTLARQIATARGDVPATDDAHAAPVAPEPDAD